MHNLQLKELPILIIIPVLLLFRGKSSVSAMKGTSGDDTVATGRIVIISWQ
jgi:hypothetical protein